MHNKKKKGGMKMDVFDIGKDFTRMCNTYHNCLGCPIDGKMNMCGYVRDLTPEVVDIIKEWAINHPVEPKEELATIKERINKAFNKIAEETQRHESGCERCGKRKGEPLTYEDGLAVGACIFADTLGIERIDF